MGMKNRHSVNKLEAVTLGFVAAIIGGVIGLTIGSNFGGGFGFVVGGAIAGEFLMLKFFQKGTAVKNGEDL
jgi:uncharacterized protein YcfJ